MEPAKDIQPTSEKSATMVFCFGPFKFFSETLELVKRGKKIPLKVQAARVLKILLQGRGELVSREAIIHEIWSDRVVEFDLSLNACIRDIRTALGDNAVDQIYIETLSKRGYRLNPKIILSEKTGDAETAKGNPQRLAIAALVGVVIIAIINVVTTQAPLVRLDNVSPEQTEAARTLVLGGVAAIYDQPVPDYPKAISAFQQAIATDPGYIEAHMMLARTVFARGDLDQIHLAERSLESILALGPENVDALALRGALMWTIHHDWQAAKIDFEKILELQPDFNQAYISLANYYSVMGDFNKSLDQVNQALNLKPIQMSGNGNVGWFYYLAGRHQEALRYCDETRAINPEGAGMRRCYLNNLITLGEVDQAAGHALALLKLKGLSENELSDLESAGAGAVLDYFTKIEAGRQVPEKNRSDPAFLFKAIALTRLGNKTEAMATLTKAYDARNYFLPFIRVIPDLSPLYNEDEFQNLLESMNFPPAYLAKS